jgi:hypothetical protein
LAKVRFVDLPEIATETQAQLIQKSGTQGPHGHKSLGNFLERTRT